MTPFFDLISISVLGFMKSLSEFIIGKSKLVSRWENIFV